MKPLVSVIIPTHDRKEQVERLIRSVLKSDYSSIEIIVIDDYSSDGTFTYLKYKFSKNKKVRLIRNKKNLFTAATRNVGIKNSKGEFLFFIDDDNVLDTKTISELSSVLESNEMIGEVGPVNYNFNNKREVLWLKTKRNMLTTKTYQPRTFEGLSGKKIWDTVDVPNAFMVRASVINKNKIMFREEFEIMYEESDFAYRIRKSGYLLKVVRGAKIYHDIEDRKEGEPIKDYMFHFMENKRRPYVTARNRIFFHYIYSGRVEFALIISFWVWFFASYYIYKIMFYSGIGKFSLLQRFSLSLAYLRGTKDGILTMRSLEI